METGEAGYGLAKIADKIPSVRQFTSAVRGMQFMGNALRSASRTVFIPSNKILDVGERQAQKKFTKHGSDFALKGNWNRGRAADVRRAINSHINRSSVQVIKGTYRGENVVHHLDPKTGLNVITKPSGDVIGGWKVSSDQFESITRNGRLF